MLARYRMTRGRRTPDDPLPEGTRIDVRKHTSHVLAPLPDMVDELLLDPTDPKRLKSFARAYEQLLKQRFADDRTPFDALVTAARSGNVHLGCSCPTTQQPNVLSCHTVLALRFVQTHYPDLDVRIPTS